MAWQMADVEPLGRARHRFIEDAPRWEMRSLDDEEFGRLPLRGTALSSYGSSRLLHGVSPAAPLQSTGAEDWDA